MLKIPYGISDYKALKEEGYCYVDKTMYLEKLEDIAKTITCLRPGRFGKTLFTSMMYYYYDVNSKDLFDTLFKDTYVYNNSTINKNNYYVLKFDFSGMSSIGKDIFELEKTFKNNVLRGIDTFNNNYSVNIIVDSSNSPDDMLAEFITEFESLKLKHKLYIIVDEYDNFTNAILEGKGERFKEVAGNEGFLKSFYATIKKYSGYGIVDRVFITGICPITLDSMTTWFNTSTNISTNQDFNEMIGLTHEEVRTLIKDIDADKQDEIFDLMLKNYDGYLFSKKSKTLVFNATLVMYILYNYYNYNEVPEEILDSNVAFNYGKIGNLLKLQKNSYYKDILDTILKTGTIIGVLKTNFNLEENFTKDDFISLLYYFGYLTIDNKNENIDFIKFRIPNKVMNDLYYNYFDKMLRDIDILIDNMIINKAVNEMSMDGKIDILTKYVEEILRLSDNRMFIKFDEKYIGIIYFTLLKSIRSFNVYQEYPLNGGYADLMMFKNNSVSKYDIMMELKYIKVDEYKKNKKLLNQKKEEAIKQLELYSKDERLDISTLKKYVVIFVGHNLKVLEEV